jgi:SAM-dependent methyltransferase
MSRENARKGPESSTVGDFKIPNRFRRRIHREVDPAAEQGASLVDYMCERIGIRDLAELDVLDFGCGSRFADAIVNRALPLKTYVGIDVYREMIEFLAATVPDPRLTFCHIDALNPMYNPSGVPLTSETKLPIGDRRFDVICMFSVITHQLPDDARSIFSILRGYVRESGRLFFSASLSEDADPYLEVHPDRPTALSVYAPGFLTTMLEETGWRVRSTEGPNPRDLPILDSILCEPA